MNDSVIIGDIAKYQCITKLAIPLFSQNISAGFPSPADDYVEQTLDLNELCIRNPVTTYFVKANGLSMTAAGINDGDILVVDRSITAKTGHIVVAYLDGEFTVKEIRLTTTSVSLVAHSLENDYQPIHINPEQDFEVFGVVTNLVRRLL